MQVIKVVIASPTDVTPERDLITETVIPSLNKTAARSKGLLLEPYRWETDSTPGFHPLGPQAKLDEELQIVDAHLLIAIFWKKFGTPIRESDETGTEHEIGLAYKKWQETQKYPDIMMYFKETPFYAGSVRDAEQFVLVRKFREQWSKGGKFDQGVYDTFSDMTEFERKLNEHLYRKIAAL